MSPIKKDIKLVIIGDANVGKTSIANYYVFGKATIDYGSTIGAAFLAKHIKINEQQLTLHIWDTAGQERFRSMGRIYYNGSLGCICVFDITKRSTFENAKRWLEEYVNNNNRDHSIIIVANKSDFNEDEWQVSREEIETFAAESGHPYFITNCVTGIHINDIFETLTKDIVENNSHFKKTKYLSQTESSTPVDNEGIIDLTKKFIPFTGSNSGNCKC